MSYLILYTSADGTEATVKESLTVQMEGAAQTRGAAGRIGREVIRVDLTAAYDEKLRHVITIDSPMVVEWNRA